MHVKLRSKGTVNNFIHVLSQNEKVNTHTKKKKKKKDNRLTVLEIVKGWKHFSDKIRRKMLFDLNVAIEAVQLCNCDYLHMKISIDLNEDV